MEESFAVMPSDDKSGRVEVPKVEFVIDEYIEMVLQSSHSSDLRFLLAAINKASPVVLPLVGDDSRIVKPLELLQSVLRSETDSCSGISEAVEVLRAMLDCMREKKWVKPLPHQMARVLEERAEVGELSRWHWRIWNNVLSEIVEDGEHRLSNCGFAIDVEGIAQAGGGKKWWVPLKELAVQEAIDDLVRWGLIAPMPRIDEDDNSPTLYVVHPNWT